MRTIDYLRAHGIDGPIASKYGLGFVDSPLPGDERFAGCLSIPYLTRAGVLRLKYRCTRDHDHRDHKGKYLQHPGNPVRLYNTRAFFEAGRTIGLTEGEMDAITATEILGIPTLGIQGVEQWKAHGDIWRHALKDWDEILFFADGNDVGIECARAVCADLGVGRGMMVKCDRGEDVSSMVAKGLTETLRERAGLT